MSTRPLPFSRIADEVRDGVYATGKYPLLCDPTGVAATFLKYRARCLSAVRRGDLDDPENLRKALTQTLHNGALLVLDADFVQVDWEGLCETAGKTCFPSEVFDGPDALFDPEILAALPRDSDEFTAKLQYESLNLEQEGLYDRTKVFDPEKCVGADTRFRPQEQFRLVVMVKSETPPEWLADKMDCILLVVPQNCSAADESAAWAGGKPPVEERSTEEKKLDSEFLECCFDGDLPAVKDLLAKGALSLAVDARGSTGLSEAACAGKAECTQYLLGYNPPLGSDPNAVNYDGRTAVHRAAFGGHSECVTMLIKEGADPRIRDKNGETAYDIAIEPEMHKLLDSFDENELVKRLEERRAAREQAEEGAVKNAEEKSALMRKRKTEQLLGFIKEGDVDSLELETMGLEGDPAGYRDERGNTMLHLAAELNRLEMCELLLGAVKHKLEARDSKGWTPLQVAAFYGNRQVCELLLGQRANPETTNAYRKNAIDLAKDENLKDLLSGNSGSRCSAAAASSSTDGPPAALPKAKAKAKSGSRSVSAGKAKAKSKSAGKAKAKSRERR